MTHHSSVRYGGYVLADNGSCARSSPKSRTQTLTARAIGPSESVRRWGCELLLAV